jgi:hypothetical protein
MQTSIKFEIVELLKAINKNDQETQSICEQTDTILSYIYKDVITSEEIENLSVLYSLIFYAFKIDPLLAYQVLSGFLRFGQSADGDKYKPLLDHLAIEAFDQLLAVGGWSILRDCINSFQENLSNLDAEPIFQHILSRIISQLYTDDHEIDNPDHLSDICHYLPREKSYVWGWFSYYIASAYYGESYETLNNKKLRNYLMQYRKLITGLRQMAPSDDPTTTMTASEMDASFVMLSETWSELLTGLSTDEYIWAANLIEYLMGCPVPVPTEPIKQPEQPEQLEQLEQAQAEQAPAEQPNAHAELENLIQQMIANIKKQADEEQPAWVEVTRPPSPTEQSQAPAEQPQAPAEQPQAKQQEPAEQPQTEKKDTTNTGGWFNWLGWP